MTAQITNGHVCESIATFPSNKFHQRGSGKGRHVLIVGESPAPNGWIVSGKACYRPDGTILPTGKRLNELLEPFGVSVETSGFTELSKCFVSKRTELETCSTKCWPIFLKQIKPEDYTLLIILGVHTTHILSKILTRTLVVGEMVDLELGGKIYKILPIFHPSPINPTGHSKNKNIFKNLSRDIKEVIEVE
jgi:uracil-DNA glycosylase family 4